jgi:XTP/dITP diphosphohydrolase
LSRPALLLATSNRGKIREIRESLRDVPLTIRGLERTLPGLRHRERGRSFLENARAKGLYYSRKWKGLVLAEDSGLEIDALGGAPGVFSARFSRPKATDEKNNRKVLRLLESVPARDRGARFVCVIVLAREGRIVKEIRGEVRGRIVRKPRGNNGFGYDPLFHYPPLGKTFAELPRAVKNRVSHRGRALRKLKAFLSASRLPA